MARMEARVVVDVLAEQVPSLRLVENQSFRVHPNAHKTQIRNAVEELFEVKVEDVKVLKVQPKPKRRGVSKGTRPGWKKAVVKLREGQEIQIFGGAQV